MQTIKTAAIVVLMLTVLYGGYVSLTTPPEPLPAEVEDFLVIEESGSESLMASSNLDLSEPPPILADNDTSAMGAFIPPANEVAALPAADAPTFGGSFAEPNGNDAGTPASAASFAVPSAGIEKPQALPPTGSPVSGSLSDSSMSLPSDAPGLPTQISPLPGNTLAMPSADVNATDRPDTGRKFTMPDPSVAAADFVPPSEPFVGGPIPAETVSSGTTQNEIGTTPALPPVTPKPNSPASPLTNAFSTADAMYGKGQLKEALATLSVFYGTPNLSPLEREQLLSRLDPLAREVIYSKRHLLEQPHRVTTKETLPRIAERYNVPWELLANINQVEDPITVLPGTELKIVRGPFRAEVDLERKELTLFLGDLYAGRFEVGIGNDPPPAPGTFSVQDKQPSHVYYNREGVPVPAGSPENPYGKAWFDLGGSLCIHGSPNTVRPSNIGCISLAGDEAEDLYAILTQGSVVTIRR